MSNHDLKLPESHLVPSACRPPPRAGRGAPSSEPRRHPGSTAPPRPRAPPTCPSSLQRALAAPAPVASRLPAAGRHGEPAGSAMQHQGAPGAGRARERRRGCAAELAAGARTGRAPGRRRGGPSLLRAAACARCLCLPRAALRDREGRGASPALRPAPRARCGSQHTSTRLSRSLSALRVKPRVKRERCERSQAAISGWLKRARPPSWLRAAP